jgi:uncharacterized protein (TIGR02996 family)
MTEDALIRAILEAPNDPALRLVYADWLEDHDDPRAAFLRLEAELNGVAETDPQRGPLRERLRLACWGINPAWLALLDRTPIENCHPHGKMSHCPGRWENLSAGENPWVRPCAVCGKDVVHCANVEEARRRARQCQVVAIDSRQARTPGDLQPPSVLGRLRHRLPCRVGLRQTAGELLTEAVRELRRDRSGGKTERLLDEMEADELLRERRKGRKRRRSS